MLKSRSVSSMDTAPSSSSCKNFVCFLEYSVKMTQNFVSQSPWVLLGSDTDGFPRLFLIWGHCSQLRLSSLLFHNCPLKNINQDQSSAIHSPCPNLASNSQSLPDAVNAVCHLLHLKLNYKV